MRKFVIPGLIVAAAVALLALLTYGVTNHADTASIDAQVARGADPLTPSYRAELPMLGSSRRTDLASFRGKVVLLNVYASWCEPCRSEAPLMAREQRVLARHGGTVVGVTYKDSSTSTEQFNREFGVHYPVLRDVSGNFVRSLGTDGVPETFLINRSGHIEALWRGPITQRWLAQHVTPVLEKS
jgi:cytochrome c biogenesis protein CcmG/thiol:disulfide interchange protein DsbE